MHADLTQQSIRTDLAIEAREMLIGEVEREIPGVAVQSEDFTDFQVTRVQITTPEAEKRMGKKQGQYTTLEVPGLRQKNTELQEMVARQFTKNPVHGAIGRRFVLVIGLGNWNVTPMPWAPCSERSAGDTPYFKATAGNFRKVFAPSAPWLPECWANGVETGKLFRVWWKTNRIF